MSCAQFNSHAPSGISSLQFPLAPRTAKHTQISRSCFYTSPSNFPASVENTDILRDEEADGCDLMYALIPFPTPPSRREHTALLSSPKPIPSPPERVFQFFLPAAATQAGRDTQGRSPGAGTANKPRGMGLDKGPPPGINPGQQSLRGNLKSSSMSRGAPSLRSRIFAD